MSANNLQFGMILLSSAIFLLASFSVCEGKSFGSIEDDDRNDINGIGNGLQYMGKSRDDGSMDDRTNEIWNNVPIMPHLNFQNPGNFWSTSSAQLQPQSFLPSGIILPPPPPRKRFILGDGHNLIHKPNGQRQQQLRPINQQQVLSSYLSNSAPGLTGSGSGSPGMVTGAGFRYRPAVSYNFRATPNGRLSGYMAPVSPRKRQILFRQCFFNPISCF